LWKAGSPEWSLGDVTNEYAPNPDNYGTFDVIGKIIGEPGNPTLPVTAYYPPAKESMLLRLARLGCDHDLQVHMGDCTDPQDFNRGWTKILTLTAARPTSWGTTDMGALMPGERASVMEEVPFTGETIYEILQIAFGAKAAAQIVQEVIDVVICDRVTCGSCGIPSDGCSIIFALTLSNAGSPGLAAEIIFTDDGGATFDDTNITTLSPSENPNAFACIGVNLVVISEDSESLHYAPIADILAGVETWAEVTTGFVATKGPLAMISLSPRHTWIVGEGGYVYFTDDPTAGVEVQDAGSATAQDLNAIHGIDTDNLVAVGASNAVILTRDGGATWTAITGPDAGVVLTSVWMHGTDEWFIGTAGGKLWYTQDAGDTWTQKTFPGSGAGAVRDIKFSSAAVGYMSHDTATPAGRILRTVSGGNSWYVAPEGNTAIPANDKINALAVCEDNVNLVWGGGLGDNATDGFLVVGAAG
jgi:photosystem II stability/assembly factor-like uncharacterized protein